MQKAASRFRLTLALFLSSAVCAQSAVIGSIGRTVKGPALPTGVRVQGAAFGATSLPSVSGSLRLNTDGSIAPLQTPSAWIPAGEEAQSIALQAAAASVLPVSVKAADVLPASAIPRPAAEAPKTKEPLYRRARKVLNGKTDHNAVYDGASGDLDAVSREAVAAHEAAPKAPAENPISKESVTIRDKDIERRTRNVVKSLRGGYLSRQTVANLREELRAVRKTYLSDELPEPGYRRAERLIRRAEGEIARKFITRAVATLELALEDIEHKTSYRATIRVRTKKDSRSRADVSYRYFVKGTRLKTMVKRLKSEGEVLWARIGRGEWVRYDHLRLDLRLRKDLVLDLVFR